MWLAFPDDSYAEWTWIRPVVSAGQQSAVAGLGGRGGYVAIADRKGCQVPSKTSGRYHNPFAGKRRVRGSSFSVSTFQELHENAVAWTPYGLARIVSQRRSDATVVLKALYYEAVFYLRACDIVQIFPPEKKKKA